MNLTVMAERLATKLVVGWGLGWFGDSRCLLPSEARSKDDVGWNRWVQGSSRASPTGSTATAPRRGHPAHLSLFTLLSTNNTCLTLPWPQIQLPLKPQNRPPSPPLGASEIQRSNGHSLTGAPRRVSGIRRQVIFSSMDPPYEKDQKNRVTCSPH